MDSFAIWYSPKDKENNNEKIDLEIHFNLWKVKTQKIGKDPTTFIDIGLKIKNIKTIKKIGIYVPFSIDKEDIEDIGEKMQYDRKLINGIFNENCNIKSGDNGIEVDKNNDKFYIKTLDFQYQKNLEIEVTNEGSIISINVSNEKTENNYYRFRIKGDSLEENFGKKISENAKIFKTEFEEKHIIDFRLNEKRALPDNLNMLIANEKEFQIKKIHFLLLISSEYDVPCTGLKYSVRALENRLWDRYLPNDCCTNDLLGYHWKKESKSDEEKIENFNSYIKISICKQGYMILVIYSLWAILIGVLINIISEFLTSENFYITVFKIFIMVGYIFLVILITFIYFSRGHKIKKFLEKIFLEH